MSVCQIPVAPRDLSLVEPAGTTPAPPAAMNITKQSPEILDGSRQVRLEVGQRVQHVDVGTVVERVEGDDVARPHVLVDFDGQGVERLETDQDSQFTAPFVVGLVVLAGFSCRLCANRALIIRDRSLTGIACADSSCLRQRDLAYEAECIPARDRSVTQQLAWDSVYGREAVAA